MEFLLLFIITLHVILYIFAIDLFWTILYFTISISIFCFIIPRITKDIFLDKTLYNCNFKEYCKKNYRNYIFHEFLNQDIKSDEITIPNIRFIANNKRDLREVLRMGDFLGYEQNQKELEEYLNKEFEKYGFKVKDDGRKSWKNKFDKQCVLCRITTPNGT
jgi:hypothetical protein